MNLDKREVMSYFWNSLAAVPPSRAMVGSLTIDLFLFCCGVSSTTTSTGSSLTRLLFTSCSAGLSKVDSLAMNMSCELRRCLAVDLTDHKVHYNVLRLRLAEYCKIDLFRVNGKPGFPANKTFFGFRQTWHRGNNYAWDESR